MVSTATSTTVQTIAVLMVTHFAKCFVFHYDTHAHVRTVRCSGDVGGMRGYVF